MLTGRELSTGIEDHICTMKKLEIGTRVGSYKITGQLGAGGMGVVYRAHDTKLDRPVAIKLLADGLGGEDARRRFEREVRTVSSLNHPHVLTVHDVGDIDGSPYLVTELVEGGTLRDWQSAGKRTWRHIVSILVGVADGLAAAHKSGILHRDVKPENVLVDGSGYAKLVDFGLAKRLDNAGAQAGDAVMDTVSGATPYDLSAPDVVTLHGSLVGTIPYMSPEQTSGGTIDDRSDIFSFGVLLHEALSGARPFNGATHTEIIAAIRDRPAPPLPQRVPSQLRWIVDKSLEKDPNDRYQSMLEVVVDLRRALRSATDNEVHSSAATKTNSPGTSRQRRAVIAVAAVVTVIALAGGFWVGRSTSPAPSMIRQSRLTELSGTEETPAVSPDGRTL